jgi:hypothetical protein
VYDCVEQTAGVVELRADFLVGNQPVEALLDFQ